MPTTFQVTKETLHLLARLKRELKAATYDEAIRHLVEERLGLPKNLFGIDKRRSLPSMNRTEWKTGNDGNRQLGLDRILLRCQGQDFHGLLGPL